jgi:ubiquinone/menaquinone biosynthesis C-methylase UbiE
MPATREAMKWRGRQVVDSQGQPIGRIEAIYLDYETDDPAWALLAPGRFESRPRFVPLDGMVAEDESIRAPFDKKAVREAPAVDASEELSQEAEAALYRHYGMVSRNRGAAAAPAAPGHASEDPQRHDAGGNGSGSHGPKATARAAQGAQAPTQGLEEATEEPHEVRAETSAETAIEAPEEAQPAGAATREAEQSSESPEAIEGERPIEAREVSEDGPETHDGMGEARLAADSEDPLWAGEVDDEDEPLEEEQLRHFEFTRSSYRMHAPVYDMQTLALQPARERAVEALKLERGDVVLDVGCGTGNAFDLIEERIGPEGRIIAIDLSPDMLAAARARVERQGWTNVELVESSAEQASVQAMADAVLILFAHDVLRSSRAVDNVLRRVRPGGRVVATGVKWAPWWAPAVNSYMVTIAASYITSFEGFDRPWAQIERYVPNIEVEELSFGSGFLASGNRTLEES